MKLLLTLLCILVTSTSMPLLAKDITLAYKNFTINYSCTRAGYNYVVYDTVPDSGNLPRYQPFHLEPRILTEGKMCLPQRSTKTYKRPKSDTQYDRGHGVHQNIWDHDKDTMKDTNYMSNIVPQERTQNRSGLWRTLEKRIECARDLKSSSGQATSTSVFLGNVWGTDSSNDHFRLSHGVITPDFLWRVHVYPDRPGQAYAWLFPNNKEAKSSNESQFRVRLSDIVKRAEYDLHFPESWVDATDQDPHVKTYCSWK